MTVLTKVFTSDGRMKNGIPVAFPNQQRAILLIITSSLLVFMETKESLSLAMNSCQEKRGLTFNVGKTNEFGVPLGHVVAQFHVPELCWKVQGSVTLWVLHAYYIFSSSFFYFSQKLSFLSMYDKHFHVDGGDLDSNLPIFLNLFFLFCLFLTLYFIKDMLFLLFLVWNW